MVKIIMGLKGSGKTKQLIELVKAGVREEHGDIVVIEKGQKLMYDIPHKARLIEASEYGFSNYDVLKGFICGLYAANYDITHVFIDSLLKIVDKDIDAKLESFIDWCERFSERSKVKFTITISADAAVASEGLRKYL
jgi:hypothetical protein